MANKFIIKGIRKFNEQKVIENTLMLINKGDDNEVKRRYNEPTCGEVESYTLMIEGLSTQGITIKQMIGGCVIVELPWLASEADVRLCYACLNAIKKTHRASRITEEDEKMQSLVTLMLRKHGVNVHIIWKNYFVGVRSSLLQA